MFSMAHRRAGNEVEIATLDGPKDGPAHDGYSGVIDCPIHCCGPGFSNYCYSSKLKDWLRTNYPRFDGIIVNGIWQYHGAAVHSVVAGRKPYVIFAHGMLDPYFRERYPLKHLKKLPYWLLQERRNLRDAQAVCFTSQEEQRVAAIGFPLPQFRGVVIPYGTPGPTGDPAQLRQAFLNGWPSLKDKKYFLFLGRIHPKKGCDLLLEAFARAVPQDLSLVMAGPDESGWGNELREKSSSLGIANRVVWTGMLRGDAKWGALYGAEAFVLPSHQENFGIAVADALACGTIPLISDKVNIAPDVVQDGAGLMDTDTVEGTISLFARFLALSIDQRREMEEKTLDCFRTRYRLDNSAPEVYRALGIAK